MEGSSTKREKAPPPTGERGTTVKGKEERNGLHLLIVTRREKGEEVVEKLPAGKVNSARKSGSGGRRSGPFKRKWKS